MKITFLDDLKQKHIDAVRSGAKLLRSVPAPLRKEVEAALAVEAVPSQMPYMDRYQQDNED